MAWSDYAVFLAVYRNGTHKGAARALGVDATTVGRRLNVLQEKLGALLFERTPSGLRLTPAGAALLPRVERVEREVLDAEREVLGADARLSGSVRVTATDGLVTHVLIPRLAQLRRSQPGLELELRSEAKNVDLSRREADLAIRLGRPREPALVARKVGSLSFGLYASREYLAGHSPRTQADLAQHDFIAFEIGSQLPQVQWLRAQVPEARRSLSVNTTASLVAACAAGHGVALLPNVVGKVEAAIVPVLPRLAPPARELWAVTHRDLRHNARVAALMDWLGRALGPL